MHVHLYRWFVTSVWMGLMGWASAESLAPAYTLEQCVAMGLERSVVAVHARIGQEVAGAQVQQARSEILPHFRVDGQYTRLDELQSIDFGDGVLEMGTLDNYSVLAEVRQILYAGGRVKAALRAARLSEQYARAERLAEETRLVRDIRQAFYDVLLAGERVRVREAAVDQLGRLADAAAAKQAAGTVSEFETLSARVRLANARPELILARSDAVLTSESLKRLIRCEESGFAVTGTLAFVEWTVPLDDLMRLADTNRPALDRQRTGVSLRREAVVAARSPGLPELAAYANTTGANAYQFVSYSDTWEWHWNAGLALNWAIWDGGMTHARIRQARLELERETATLEDLESGVRLELRDAWNRMQHAREAVQAGRETVTLAERAQAIAQSRYETGLGTQLEYADSTVALREARLALSTALAAHLSAQASLEYAAGIDPLARRAGHEEQP